jgi:hypothetical protein
MALPTALPVTAPDITLNNASPSPFLLHISDPHFCIKRSNIRR